MDFFPAAATVRSPLLQNSGYAKIMVMIHSLLTILQFVYSPFFQLICNFRAFTRSVISQPTDGLLSPRWRLPLAFITTKGRCKNNGEKLISFDDVSVVSLTIVSIKMTSHYTKWHHKKNGECLFIFDFFIFDFHSPIFSITLFSCPLY